MNDVEALLNELGAAIAGAFLPNIIKTIFKPSISSSRSVISISIDGKKIQLDRKLIEKIRNTPDVWSNPDIIEKIAQRYPGIDFSELRRAIEDM